MSAPDSLTWEEVPQAADSGLTWEPVGPSFANVQGGAATAQQPAGTLSQFDDFSPEGMAVNGTPDTLTADYADVARDAQGNPVNVDPEDQRRFLGMGEGFVRTAAKTLSEIPTMMLRAPGASLAMNAIDALRGKSTPDQLDQGAEKTIGVDPETMRFAGPAEEAFSTGAGMLLGNAIPLGPAAKGERLVKEAGDALHDAKLAGDLGTIPQSQAVGDEIVNQAISDAPKVETPATPAPATTTETPATDAPATTPAADTPVTTPAPDAPATYKPAATNP
jgi:hypothetical protein